MAGMIGCERGSLKVFTTAIISGAAAMVHSVPLPPFLQALAIPDHLLGGQSVDGCQQHTSSSFSTWLSIPVTFRQ